MQVFEVQSRPGFVSKHVSQRGVSAYDQHRHWLMSVPLKYDEWDLAIRCFIGRLVQPLPEQTHLFAGQQVGQVPTFNVLTLDVKWERLVGRANVTGQVPTAGELRAAALWGALEFSPPPLCQALDDMALKSCALVT